MMTESKPVILSGAKDLRHPERKRRLLFVLFCFSITADLAHAKKPSKAARNVKKRELVQVQPPVVSPQDRYAAELKTVATQDYHYRAFELADPFVQPRDDWRGLGPASKGEAALLRFPLQDFSLVGTWTTAGGVHKALVISPEDEGLIIGTGDSLGDQQGKVVAIDEESLKVRQSITSSSGERYFEDYQLLLNNE